MDNNIFMRFLNRSKLLLLGILHRLLGIICLKDKNYVVFESEYDFSDNSFALFRYLNNHYSQLRFAWMCHNKNNCIDYNKRTVCAYHPYNFHSLKDCYILSKAKYIFFTHGLGSSFHPTNRQIVVNLWHGSPIKGRKGPAGKMKFDIMLCLGDMDISANAKFVGCDPSKLRPWGLPRLDLLYSNKGEGKDNPFVPVDHKGKVIIWMPTFRAAITRQLSETIVDTDTGLPLLADNSSLIGFDNFLKTIDVIIIVKIHHLQAQKSIFKSVFSNIVFLQDTQIRQRGLQLYEVVAKTDALITDYSSIFADYLLMDRPIGFILDDISDYEKSRGSFLYQPVIDVLCGSHIYDVEQLQSFCEEISKNIDSTKHFRDSISNRMIKYPDGKNCERITKNVLQNITLNKNYHVGQ